MVENVESILRVVTFIAVGGTCAIIFFFIFAQTIIGLKTLHKQLEKLIEQNEKMLELLQKNLKKTDSNKKHISDTDEHWLTQIILLPHKTQKTKSLEPQIPMAQVTRIYTD